MIAVSEAIKELEYLRLIINDFYDLSNMHFYLFEDNQSTLHLMKNDQFYRNSKHYLTKVNFVREYILKKKLSVEYCPTNLMKADILTKALGKIKHQQNVKLLDLNN